ncbi:MAG: alkaline phosphatase family protein, partial [Acidobacteriota bacterium]|nr:alkaline phosphatase family protein [Acidobacteriota bacterium]
VTPDNLDKIEHIVVLMLENRSFDHMLGYLKLEGVIAEVDGLSGEMYNIHGGKKYHIMPLTNTVFKEDPCHEGDCVEQQLGGDNGGFVANFAHHHPGTVNLRMPACSSSARAAYSVDAYRYFSLPPPSFPL